MWHEYDHLVPLFHQLATMEPADARRSEVRHSLITGHLPLAEHIAQRFSGKGASKEDLIQVATVGLINAVDRFDPAKANNFLSYAVPTMMGEVRKHFRDATWPLRVPRRLKELCLSVANGSAKLTQELGRAPTPREISEHLNIPREDVYQGLEAGKAYRSLSLDEPLSQEDNALSESIGEEDGAYTSIENYQALVPVIQALPERERRILVLRFFHDMTQSQIAEKIGISQMHVSRILSRTLQKLRDDLTP